MCFLLQLSPKASDSSAVVLFFSPSQAQSGSTFFMTASFDAWKLFLNNASIRCHTVGCNLNVYGRTQYP